MSEASDLCLAARLEARVFIAARRTPDRCQKADHPGQKAAEEEHERQKEQAKQQAATLSFEKGETIELGHKIFAGLTEGALGAEHFALGPACGALATVDSDHPGPALSAGAAGAAGAS